ncbi:hypothetical protein D3C80_1019490 [compost metagenome]
MTISRYSSRSSFERSSYFRISAKPLIETMGVLNSWEKLFTKSVRKISMPPSSSAIRLKFSDRIRYSGGFFRCRRVEKSPAANRLMASMNSWTDLTILRLAKPDIVVPIIMQDIKIMMGNTIPPCTISSFNSPKKCARKNSMPVITTVMRKIKKTISENKNDRLNFSLIHIPSLLIDSVPPYNRGRGRTPAQTQGTLQSVSAGG